MADWSFYVLFLEARPEWNEWSPWGRCSRVCSGGVHFRTRTCGNAIGHQCVGNNTEYSNATCNTRLCDFTGFSKYDYSYNENK